MRRAFAGIALAALGFHVAQLQFGILSGSLGELLDVGLYHALLGAAAIGCLARAYLHRRDRLAWALVGLGLSAWSAAEVYWPLALADLDSPPYPSLADAGWLVIYPTSYAAVLLLTRSARARVPAATWLDGAIAATGASALAAALLFEPILAAATEGDAIVIATNMAYPVGDLVLLALVAGAFGLDGWRPDRRWVLLGAGLAASAVADSWYLATLAKGTYSEASVLNALWPAAALLMAAAAWQPGRRRSASRGGWRLISVPVASPSSASHCSSTTTSIA